MFFFLNVIFIFLLCANKIQYQNIIVSPLYYTAMKYYDDLYYTVIENNLLIANGGKYKSNGVNSIGFALYTDNLLQIID